MLWELQGVFLSKIVVLSKYFVFSLLLLLSLAVALHCMFVTTSPFLGKPHTQLREFSAWYFPLNFKRLVKIIIYEMAKTLLHMFWEKKCWGKNESCRTKFWVLKSRLVKKNVGVTSSLRCTVLDNEQPYNHKAGMYWWLTSTLHIPSVFLLQLFDIISFTLTMKDWFKAKNELNPANPIFPSIYQARYVLSLSMHASLKPFSLW